MIRPPYTFAKRKVFTSRHSFSEDQQRKGVTMATVIDQTAQDRWQQEAASAPQRETPTTTVSSVPIEPLYTAESLNGVDPDVDLGYPGQYPFARGIHAAMYLSRLWTMRQLAGFGAARQTNER